MIFAPGFVAGGGKVGGNDAFTTLLLHMDGVNGSATFTDSSASALTVTANNGAVIDTSVKKFGTGCGLFANLSGADYLTIANNAALTFGTGDFTIDWWELNDSLHTANIVDWGGDTAVLMFQQFGGGSATVYMGGTGHATPAGTVVADATFHHYALVRFGTAVNFYKDGTSILSFTNSTNLNTPGTWYLGSHAGAGGNVFYGRLDEMRFSKGIARWTANFTPPIAAYA